MGRLHLRVAAQFGAIVGVLLAGASVLRADEFRIGPYLAESLLGDAAIVEGRDYVSFAGDTAFVNWVPDDSVLDRYVDSERELLSRFQLNVVNLEHVLVGFSGRDLDERSDTAILAALRRVGYGVVSLANNHALDAGPRGVSFTRAGLDAAKLSVIGLRSNPTYEWRPAGKRIAIFALTSYTDRSDSERLALTLSESDVELVRQASAGADSRIAFVHLGSMSSYPSAHERQEVGRLLRVGVDLVVCTGSHFVKGFVREAGTPVFYGLGDHLLSSVNAGTEDIGIHAVAGFSSGRLVQLFIVPFRNNIHAGNVGPLDPERFRAFLRAFDDRSTTDTSRYYSDPRARAVLSDRLRNIRLSDLRQIRLRQFGYAARILWESSPVGVIAAGSAVLAAIVLLVRWRRRSAKATLPVARIDS